MSKFPNDARKADVLRALQALGFKIVREREHISMVRDNSDGSRTPLTLPNHPRINGATLRRILTQSKIEKDDFLKFFDEL